MTTQEMENIISEVEHSLAVEHMVMTDDEKENLRRVGRGWKLHGFGNTVPVKR